MNSIVKVMEVAGTLAKKDIRDAIISFQASIEQSGLGVGREAFPLRHTIINGVYAREIIMRAGDSVVGGIHRHAHLNFIMRGKVWVLTEHEGCQVYEAPYQFVSPAGTKRLVHVLEDCLWVTIHNVVGTTPEECEAEVIAESYDDIEINGEFKEVL